MKEARKEIRSWDTEPERWRNEVQRRRNEVQASIGHLRRDSAKLGKQRRLVRSRGVPCDVNSSAAGNRMNAAQMKNDISRRSRFRWERLSQSGSRKTIQNGDYTIEWGKTWTP